MVRLLTEGGFEVISARGDAIGLMDELRSDPPDAVLIDVRMPPTNTTEGLEAAIDIRRELPHIGVLVLSQHLEPTYAVRLLENTPSGVGYLLKDRITSSQDLIDAVCRVVEGGSVIDPEVVDRLLDKKRRPGTIDALTEREREVLRLMASGASNTTIAEALFVTPKTIEHHTHNIFVKLGLLDEDGHRRVLAVLEFLRAH